MLDPVDLRRQARIMRERQQVGPLGRLLRYVAVVLVLGAAVAAYWNFDTLRGITVNFPDLTAFVSRGRDAVDGTSSAGGETGTAVVEAAGVAGVEAPSSLPGSPPPAKEAAAPARPAPLRSSAEPAPAEPPEPRTAEEPGALAAESAVPTAPAPPPEPESFSFGGIKRVEVNEAEASAAILVVRSGDMRRPSSVRWWTTDGTAKAGQDYVDLGRVVLKFAPQEQNRGIHVPIIGDKAHEGPESFYVNIAWGEDEGPAERIEVVIVDDD